MGWKALAAKQGLEEANPSAREEEAAVRRPRHPPPCAGNWARLAAGRHQHALASRRPSPCSRLRKQRWFVVDVVR